VVHVVHVAPAFTCTLLVLLVSYAALPASRDTSPSGVVTAPAWADARNPARETSRTFRRATW